MELMRYVSSANPLRPLIDKQKGNSVLIRACAKGLNAIVTKLMKNGADLNSCVQARELIKDVIDTYPSGTTTAKRLNLWIDSVNNCQYQRINRDRQHFEISRADLNNAKPLETFFSRFIDAENITSGDPAAPNNPTTKQHRAAQLSQLQTNRKRTSSLHLIVDRKIFLMPTQSRNITKTQTCTA
jgi:ankyrin repeat protein